MRFIPLFVLALFLCLPEISCGQEPGELPAEEKGVVAPAEPETLPDGWTAAKLAALGKLELRLKHLDTYFVYYGLPQYQLGLSVFDPTDEGGGESVCINFIRLETNVGLFYMSEAGCLKYDEGSGFSKGSITKKAISILKATADVRPRRGAPDSSMLRDVDITDLLRAAPPPVTVQPVTAKGPLPTASLGISPTDDLKSTKIFIHVSDVYYTPEGELYYVWSWRAADINDYSPRDNVRVRLNGREKVFWDYHNVANKIYYRSRKGEKRLTFERFIGEDEHGPKRPINLLPLLHRYDFKILPIFTKKGPLPPCSSGKYVHPHFTGDQPFLENWHLW